MQYNGKTAFYQSSAMSGGLALLRAVSQWKIEHEVRKCCVKNMALRYTKQIFCFFLANFSFL